MRSVSVLWFAVALACSGSSQPPPDATCSAVFGQDCGQVITVTLNYIAITPLDAGEIFGGIDAGSAGPLQCWACSVDAQMPLAQFEYAVKTKDPCAVVWTSESAVTLSCGSCNSFSSGAPPGAENGACVWSPPLLTP